MLKEKFGEFGEVGDVYIPRNFGTQDPRGFAFVRFLDKRDAEDAQRGLDGTMIDGREIKIQEAKEKRPENPKEHMSIRDRYYFKI
jgi:RNA recognition motif-containing protein